MKILFIDGHFTHNGWLCIRKNGLDILGDFRVWDKTRYLVARKCIRVVKQKKKWDTFMILRHELTHWISHILLPTKLCDRFDDWLDRD